MLEEKVYLWADNLEDAILMATIGGGIKTPESAMDYEKQVKEHHPDAKLYEVKIVAKEYHTEGTK